ncbi:hypothetical protein J1N35_041073 [Gossypium stocksii]|uniref:Uncharacterized protein n=1 Tax=Gossypium stocksii TaxID=47602 RepID=A0A9D3UEX6_9ROSI|nr:hypothetical protein J1N35_041073 [Gossypium stocksii]
MDDNSLLKHDNHVAKFVHNKFLWKSYSNKKFTPLIPSWVHDQQALFVTNIPLINFHKVEMHAMGRVLR